MTDSDRSFRLELARCLKHFVYGAQRLTNNQDPFKDGFADLVRLSTTAVVLAANTRAQDSFKTLGEKCARAFLNGERV